jgi:hypothetical protein
MTPKLMSTKDYSRFDLCLFNRSVAKKKDLRESMKDHGFIPAYPIHCEAKGSRLLIKAGHHRFEVAQELGIAVYYVVSEDTATIHELEKATTRWTVEDYLESYIRCGNEGYIALKEYHEETGIPLGMCVAILGGETATSGNKLQQFKDGRFCISGQEHADDIKRVVTHCQAIGISVNQNFVAALSRCLRVPEFSIEVFLTRASSNRDDFKKCRTVIEQMRHFEEIYNYKAQHHNKLALCFLADQAMRKRSCVRSSSVTTEATR